MHIILGFGIGLVVVHFVLWQLGGGIARAFKLPRRKQLMASFSACLLPALALAVTILLHRLDIWIWTDPERACAAELTTLAELRDARDVKVDRRFDFWNKTISGGGWFMPWISYPYEDPRVDLYISFRRHDVSHKGVARCSFILLPGKSDKRVLEFQRIEMTSASPSIWPDGLPPALRDWKPKQTKP